MVNLNSPDLKPVGSNALNALKKNIPDISQKMQAAILKTLEEDGLVRRQTYAEMPPRVEYSLTERAVSLLPHINDLIV